MKWSSIIIVAFAVGLTACQPPAPKNPAADPAAAATPSGSNAAASAAAPEYNLGDVEFSTISSLVLGPQSRIPTIQYTELRNPITKGLTTANAVVSQPLPDHLYVTAVTTANQGYRNQDTVLIRVGVKLDSNKDPIATKSYVFSGKQLNREGVSFDVDLIPHLNPTPATVLVQAWLKIVWFPNTNPSTVDPDTADESKGQSVEKLSNPFRIDFK